jgi:hypothetical protein
MVMKKQALLFAFALIFGGVVAVGTGAPGTDTVTAAKGGVPGAPGGNGGGGGDEAVPDYGDLFIVYRDERGVPIPSPLVRVDDPDGVEVDGGLCWQPLAAEASDNLDFLYDYDANGVPFVTEDQRGIPVDQYTCGVEAAFAALTQEVDFGRINQARSPVTVFESQLEDVVTNLSNADSTSLDPAGRMVASTCELDDTGAIMTTTSTIDSPLQNLAIYRELMLNGDSGVIRPELRPQGAGALDTAARGLGVASDKGGEVNVDMVAYLNQAMGLDEMPTILPKLTQTYREEVQGTIQLVTRSFLDYNAYGYDRGANFGALPFPEYIPGGAPTAGWFEYLSLVPNTNPPLFEIVQGPIMGAVFDGVVAAGDNIGGFARAADDTRAVINFMHDWPMPDADVYGTPVPCTPSDDINYDVSISEVSGLQVPRNIVDGSSDRELIVTVANSGDDATVTLRMTAVPAVDGLVEVDLGDGSGFISGSSFEFAPVVIKGGASTTFTAFISVDIGQKTTIDWTAYADAGVGDLNPANNIATAVSNVKVTSGGGRP